MSVYSYFSKEVLYNFKKVSINFNDSINFHLHLEEDDEITLIYIYLYICKLTEELDIKNSYSREANKIYLKYFSNKNCILNEFDWTELKLYNYNLIELFNYDIYCLKENVEINHGRCLFKEDDCFILQISNRTTNRKRDI